MRNRAFSLCVAATFYASATLSALPRRSRSPSSSPATRRRNSMSILTRSTTSRATRCGCALTASTPRATTRSSCVTSPRTTLFRKPLRVGGLRDDEKSPHEERRRECFDVSFFPEGGYLVNGYSCRVGFKALGDDGRPRFSEGGCSTTRATSSTPCAHAMRASAAWSSRPVPDGATWPSSPTGRDVCTASNSPMPRTIPSCCASTPPTRPS